jgi:hypothetical protein
MKITRQDLHKLVLQEVEKLPPDIREGVMDFLKGAGGAAAGKASDTGKSIAKAVGDKATAAKNKVGQVAGDIKNAGAVASLKADVEKASQEAGMQIQGLYDRFTDLLARAQSLRLEAEEKVIKAEMQALKNYQETAAAEAGDPNVDYTELGNDLMGTSPAQSDPMVADMNGGEEPDLTGTDDMEQGPWGDETPTDVELPPMNTKSTEKPKPISMKPKPVSMPPMNQEPFDWRSDKAKAQSPQPSTITSTNPIKKKKPSMRTKLDRTSIEKAVRDADGNVSLAAKKLGISKDQMLQALKQ